MSDGDLVVDANAILRFFFHEKGGESILRKLEQAHKGHRRIILNIVNYGEIYYTVKRQLGIVGILQWKGTMDQLPIHIYPLSISLVEEAAEIKATYHLPYADAFCAATALREGASILTGDRDFRSIQKIVPILWVL